ncbi:MAG: phosphopyruvate hydratase [Pirellulales bacterium]
MARIAELRGREVLDSRGWPTVEVDLRCDDGVLGRAIVPSGASTGAAEAHELRDDDPRRHDGRGVLRAVAHVDGEIAAALRGMHVADQATIDRRLVELDGTPNKSRLGANAVLGASLAAAHAAAASQSIPLWRHLQHLVAESFAGEAPTPTPQLPLPMTNLISGGLHAGGNLDFQDVLVMPVGAASLAEALEWIARTYRRLSELLSAAGYEGRLVGDEGGFGPRLESNEQAIEFVVRAIEAAKLSPGDDMTIALDVAATHFFNGERYQIRRGGRQQALTSEDMIGIIDQLAEKFPITSIEDPLAEEDWPGWTQLTAKLGTKLQIVGDDLIATNPTRLQRAIDDRAANAALIKLNQIGTLSETLDAIRLARSAGFRYVVSARSGETEDTTIADLAVATAADQIKIGSIVRGERLSKYNRLLRIAEELGDS